MPPEFWAALWGGIAASVVSAAVSAWFAWLQWRRETRRSDYIEMLNAVEAMMQLITDLSLLPVTGAQEPDEIELKAQRVHAQFSKASARLHDVALMDRIAQIGERSAYLMTARRQTNTEAQRQLRDHLMAECNDLMIDISAKLREPLWR